MNNHRLEGGGFKGCQLEIDCRREEARHPGSLCTPLPSRPLCFLNSPPDILGPRSAGPKTSSSGEQTPEGVLGSLFLLATARSYSGPGVVGRIRTRGRGRVQPYPRLCAAHVPSRSDESDRAHEPLLDRSKPFYDISVSKRCALLGPFSCALRACSDARDHNTTIFSSPKGEGFRPSPEETLKRSRIPVRVRCGRASLDNSRYEIRSRPYEMARTSYCSEREPVEPRSRPVLVLALFAVGDVYVSLCKKKCLRSI